jgi:hypothetical protein
MKFALIAGYFLVAISAYGQHPAANIEAPASIVAARRRWPLDSNIVRSVAQQMIPDVDLSQALVVPPPDFTTQARDPQLELKRIQESPEQGRLFVTLRCRERSACGSFVVELILPNAQVLDASHRKKLVLMVGPHKPGISSASGPILVHPHTIATLVIEEDELRITESVLPAKRARLGETVRVVDPATHHSMLAAVAGPGLLRPVDEAGLLKPEGAK